MSFVLVIRLLPLLVLLPPALPSAEPLSTKPPLPPAVPATSPAGVVTGSPLRAPEPRSTAARLADRGLEGRLVGRELKGERSHVRKV